MLSPDAGTLIPYEYTIALAENAVDNGVEARTPTGTCTHPHACVRACTRRTRARARARARAHARASAPWESLHEGPLLSSVAVG